MNVSSKPNDDNNNIICDNRSPASETDCSSLANSESRTSVNGFAGVNNNNTKAATIQHLNGGEGFQYETISGGIIKSVVAPGKGIRVDYKVSVVHVFMFARHILILSVQSKQTLLCLLNV